MLKEHKYVQVRGTPASGKTTVAKLLHAHIHDNEPDIVIARLAAWKPNDQLPDGWRRWLADSWNAQEGSFLIVDEAQSSYWDYSFWTDIKAISPHNPFHLITFASYGSSGGNDSVMTPHTPHQEQVVGLHAIDQEDGRTVGLLLTRAEFHDFIEKRFAGHSFSPEFLESIHELTAGHVGACEDVLQVIQAHDSYRSRRFNQEYTSEIFTTQVDAGTLFHSLAGKSIFSRGLPKVEYLGDPALAKVFRQVSRFGAIDVVVPPSFSRKGLDPSISLAHRNGWLYSEQTKPSQATLRYTFASPLHERYVEWILFKMPRNPEISEKKLVDFAIAVIRKFSPLNLETPRRLGTYVQRIPEAQYQDEFYRACSDHTQNCVASFPEFGNKQGRIDFFIPSKKWGVELLRDGNRIAPHSERFTEGEYGKWIKEKTMEDYIILDFRSQRLPRRDPKPYKNLYYVVYQKGTMEISIYDNKRTNLHNFRLLHHQFV